MLDAALAEIGQLGEGIHYVRALEIFERLGDLENQAIVLNNLGGAAYYAGRWDDAVALYEQGGELAERAGDLNFAAYGHVNVGEVLSDRGEYEEAERRLRLALRAWRAGDDQRSIAWATVLLGRLAMRRGRCDEGRRLLELALAELVRLRLEADAAIAEAAIAETALVAGEVPRAIAILDRLTSANGDDPLLLGLGGLALAETGADGAGRRALQESLTLARARGSDYDVAHALDALAALAHRAGSPDRTLERERDAVLGRLGVVELPPPRLDATVPAAEAPRPVTTAAAR
jgi:tetratricopeptide (TPR) repeat protein